MPFNFDLHTHSFFSGDGVSSPEDLIAGARAKGLHGIAMTDHNTCDAVTYMLEKGLMYSRARRPRDPAAPLRSFPRRDSFLGPGNATG